MRFLHRSAIRHPLASLSAGLLILLFAAPGIVRLTLRTDGHALVPPNAPEVRDDAAFRAEFHLLDPIVVLIRTSHADGIYNTHTLELVQTLTDELRKVDGVQAEQIASLATEPGRQVRPGTLEYQTLIEVLPRTALEFQRLRRDIDEIRLYNGTLVSLDGRATAIFVGAPVGVDRVALYSRIREMTDRQPLETERVDVIGAPVAEALLGSHILADLGVPHALLGTAGERGEPPGPEAPLAYRVRVWIGRHVGLVPVTLVLMVLVFLIAFRRVAAALIPLIEMGAALIFVFGLMGWFGVPVYLTIAVLPIVLTVTGVADEIHIFRRYVENLRRHPGAAKADVVRRTMDEMYSPVIQTAITTAVGFASFAFAPIAPIWAFGVFTAVGTLFCLIWSLLVMPALLILLPTNWSAAAQAQRGGAPAGSAPLRAWAGVVARRPVLLLVGSLAAVALLAPGGLKRLVIQDSWINSFDPSSRFYEATRYFDRQFLGAHILHVALEFPAPALDLPIRGADVAASEMRVPADRIACDPAELKDCRLRLDRLDASFADPSPPDLPPAAMWWSGVLLAGERVGDDVVLRWAKSQGSPVVMLHPKVDEPMRLRIECKPLMRPDTLALVGELERFLRQRADESVGGVIGPTDYLSTTNFIVMNSESARSVPTDTERIAWLWGNFARVRGPLRMGQVASSDYRRAVVTIYLRDSNFVSTAALMRSIRDFEREKLAPAGIGLRFAGDVAVSQTLIGAITTTQIRSLLGSLVGIWLVTALLGRSALWGLYCLAPCGLAVLGSFAALGWLGIPLGVATSVFSGMILGVGVDYGIHMLERYRLARAAGASADEALRESVCGAGPAILIDGVAVSLGFGVMMLSQVPPNANLGAIVAASMGSCLLATMVLVPALLRLAPPRVAAVTAAVPAVADS